MLKLRPYQREARKAVRLAYEAGRRKVIVAHATGTGKTVLFARIIKKRGGRALVLAHRTELIFQAANKLADVGLQAGIIKAERKEVDADIIVASVQTIINCLPAVLAHGEFTTVVVDEAHHAIADTYQKILAAVASPETLVLGVTATPFRGNPSEGLGDIFESIVHSYGIEAGIADGFLCPIVGKAVKLAGADYTKLKVAHGDISESSAAKVLLDAAAPSQVALAIKKFAVDRATLVFAPTVEVAEQIEERCSSAGLEASSIFGHTREDKRMERLEAFKHSKLQVLVNCGVLTEGYDEPRVACVAMVRPTKSQLLFTQIIGRGTRPHPDKKDLLVLDFVGATHRHDLVSVGTILPKSVEKLTPEVSWKDKGSGGPKDWLFGGVFNSKPGAVNASGELIATSIDLFSTRPFAWIKTSFGYVLDCGKDHGTVALRETGSGNWIVQVLYGDGTSAPVWSGSSFGYAQAHAEQYVKASGAAGMVKRDAQWRKAPMTEGQFHALTKWKVPFTTHWNRGQAADALTKTISEYRFKKAMQ